MRKFVTREEWFKAMIDGKIGMKTDRQSYYFKYIDGAFKCFMKSTGNERTITLRAQYDRSNVYYIEDECEMTIKEIEQQLGITNLKIVGESK